ncbi:MAG TPA: MarR family winged helix-turn-helix transcriptional regulator [Reyranella sp.]|nr:MarR family winged helix-turn-helix transcriptional regulator [Reyranella sp.]
MVASANTNAWSGPLLKAWPRLMRIPPLVLDRVQADLKAAGHPPLEWYDVLLELDRELDGRLRPTTLAKRMLIARYNLTRLVDRLVNAGLVKREECQEDARGAVIAITPDGRRLREAMWPVYADAVRRHLGEKLTADELDTLARLLGKLG